MYDPISLRFFCNRGKSGYGLDPALLIEQDLTLYLQARRSEWVAHVALLMAAGWRKAQAT